MKRGAKVANERDRKGVEKGSRKRDKRKPKKGRVGKSQ